MLVPEQEVEKEEEEDSNSRRGPSAEMIGAFKELCSTELNIGGFGKMLVTWSKLKGL